MISFPREVLLSPQADLHTPAQSWGPAGLFSVSQRRRGLSRLVREGALGKRWGPDVGRGELPEGAGMDPDCKWPWCQCAPLTWDRQEHSPPPPSTSHTRGSQCHRGGDQVRGLGRGSGHVYVSCFTPFDSESSPGNHPCTQVQGSLSFLRLFSLSLG